MIPNPTDSDLQKAIDDITNTTSVEPMFSDPVAAPSTIPEGDDGSLDEAIGPFPAPKIEIPEPKFEPLELPNVPEVPGEMPVANYEVAEVPEYTPEPVITESHNADMSIAEVKKAALKDLLPLLDEMKINPSQKFRIYRDGFETLHDNSIIGSAYNTAREIPDEKERAEALLEIYNITA